MSSIRREMLVWFLSLVVFLAGINLIVASYIVFHRSTDVVKGNLLVLSETKAQNISQFIEGERRLSLSVASSLNFRDYLLATPGELERMKELALERMWSIKNSYPDVVDIVLAGKDGVVDLATHRQYDSQDLSSEKIFSEGMLAQYFHSISKSRDGSRLIYSYSAPVKDSQGNTLGVAIISFRTDELFSQLQRRAGLGKTGETFLVDSEGYFLTPSLYLGDQVILKQKLDTENVRNCFAETLDGRPVVHKEVEVYDDYRGKKIFGTHEYIPNEDWCLIAKIDYSEGMRFTLEILLTMFGILTAMLAFSIVMVVFLSGKISNPIENLSYEVSQLAEGKYDYPLKRSSVKEVDKLVESIGTLASNVVTSRQEIERQVEELTKDVVVKNKDLEKFKMAVEGTTDQVVITDSDGIILYANPAMEKITGYEIDKVVGKKAGSKETWGGQMDLDFYKKMWQIIKIDQKPFIGEITNKRKSGELYIVRASISPIMDDGVVKYFVGVERDISREKEIDKMKTEFISLASHQLRTPLSAMRWFSEMLLEGDLGKLTEDQTEYVKNIENMNQRMIELVNSLLNISRIESGRLTISPQPTDIAKLIDDVLRDVKANLETKGQHLVVNVHPDLPQIMLDPSLIRQVILNLITNASKYSPNDSEIDIIVSKDEKDLICQVSDHGYGIPAGEVSRMFTKFYRASNIVKKDAEGSGLGLYLVKSIVESSGGRIWLESKENEGTTFWFTVPLSGVKPHQGEVTLTDT